MQERDLHQTPVIGQGLNVLGQIAAAHHIKDQIKPADLLRFGQKILIPVVKAALSSQILAGFAFLLGASRGKDPRPQCAGNLDGSRADSRRPAMHQEPLTRLEPAAHHDVGPDGKAGFRQTGGIAQAHPRRDGQGVCLVAGGIFSIAAAGQKCAHLVADLPARHTRPHLNHGARPFQPRQGRGAGRWRIGPRALQRVGAVHPGIGEPDDDLAMARHWNRHRHRLQHIRPARLIDRHRQH